MGERSDDPPYFMTSLFGTAAKIGGLLFTSIVLFNGVVNADETAITPGQLLFGAGLAGRPFVAMVVRHPRG